MKGTHPDSRFSRPAKAYEDEVVRVLAAHAYVRLSKDTASLENVEPVSLQVEEGYEYAIAVHLRPGAAFSEVAQRGLIWRRTLPNGKTEQVNADVAGPGILMRGVSGGQTGTVTVKLRPTLDETSTALGTGELDVEIYRSAERGDLKSREAFDQERAEATRGYSVAKTWKGDLASATPPVLSLPASACHVLVVELAPDARWGRSFVQSGGGSFLLRAENQGASGGPGVVGPGAVATFGCGVAGSATLIFGAAKADAYALGTGAYTATLYRKRLSAEELAKIQQDEAASRNAQSERMNQLQRERCRECRRKSNTKNELETCARMFGDANACY